MAALTLCSLSAAYGTARAGASEACRAGSTRALVTPSLSYAAAVRGLARARRRPGGRLIARFGEFNVNGVPTVFGVLGAVTGRDCRASWYHLQLPLKPNGVTGYVRAHEVALRPVRARVLIDLSERWLSLYDRGRLVLKTPVAIGAVATPTPTGRFYVNQRFRTDPAGPFGAAAIGISAFSEVLTGWPQGGPVAIHGTNRPSLLGERVSNGCIRVSNAVIRTMWRLAPTGTLVLVRV